jgi:hypothetical protein
MHVPLKWRSCVLALVAAFVPLASAAATLLEVGGRVRYPDSKARSNCAVILHCIWLKLSLPAGVSSRLRLAIPRHPTA